MERSTKIVNLMTTGGEGVLLVLGHDHISHIGKQHYFFKIPLPFSGTRFRQTTCKVIMTKKGSTKILNFMTPGQGFLCWGGAI